MRGFVALLERDWRTHRAMVAAIGFAILGLSMLFRSIAPDAGYWHSAAVIAVPAMTALFLTGLAADVISAEFASRRIEALALIPASLLRIWTSKAVLVTLLLALLLAWTAGCQCAAFLAFDRDDAIDEFSRFVSNVSPIASFALPVAAIALFFAAVIERTLPALFLGLIASGGVLAGAIAFVRLFLPEIARTEWGEFAACQAVGLLFAAGAATVFVRGRVHTGSTLLRWGVAGATIGEIALLFAGLGGWRYWSWRQLAPGDDEAVVQAISTSPDGRWISIQAVKYVQGPDTFTAARVWMVPIDAAGPIVEPSVGTFFDRRHAWSQDSNLRTIGRDGNRCVLAEVDPATGAVRSSQTVEMEERTREFLRDSYPYWATRNDAFAWNPDRQVQRVVEWKERGISRALTSVRNLVVSRLPGVVWYSPDGRAIHRLDLATGEDRRLFESPDKLTVFWSSCSGNRLMVSGERRSRVLDASTGAVLGGPWDAQWAGWATGSEEDGRIIHLSGQGRSAMIDLQTGLRIELSKESRLGQFNWVDLRPLPDGRLVRLDTDGTIDLLTADGAPIRRLYPPKGN